MRVNHRGHRERSDFGNGALLYLLLSCDKDVVVSERQVNGNI